MCELVVVGLIIGRSAYGASDNSVHCSTTNYHCLVVGFTTLELPAKESTEYVAQGSPWRACLVAGRVSLLSQSILGQTKQDIKITNKPQKEQ
jgi:hypothetical protein